MVINEHVLDHSSKSWFGKDVMRGSKKFCQRGSNSDVVLFLFFLLLFFVCFFCFLCVFLVDEGR